MSYRYRALDASGSETAGELAGGDRAGALESLARRGLTPIELTQTQTGAAKSRNRGSRPAGTASRWQFLPSARRMRFQDWLPLMQALAALLRAGLQIDRALQIAGPLAQSEAARSVLSQLLEEVRRGTTFSDALRKHGTGLPTLYMSMVNAGEVGGTLPAALSRVASLMIRQASVRERLRSALIYPTLLAVMVLVTMLILLMFVLPRFELLFAEATSELPLSTRIVLGAGRVIADYWWVGAAALLASVLWFIGKKRSMEGREQLDRWLLRSRWTLGLPAGIDSARLFRTVGTLCEGGQPLTSALKIGMGTIVNSHMRSALARVIAEVQAGAAFSQSLFRSQVFPAVAVQMARVGEETGCLEQMLQSAADVLEDDSQRRIERLVTMVVPLITIFMGLVVAALIGSVLIGLLSINELAF